eukprot:TRINITY_DN29947_c0_g1_i2.p3 TRINITY_DN29947_c0_g1~~TRINITY_DN29947_c0_g1_i2.p3  ORF type:complete len:366 (+),score=109.24 TRINITY_DN29947_c0_g1_i2:1511-2608(+)
MREGASWWHLGNHEFEDRPLKQQAEQELSSYRCTRGPRPPPPRLELRRVIDAFKRSKSKRVSPRSARRSCKQTFDAFKEHCTMRELGFSRSAAEELKRVTENSAGMFDIKREVILNSPVHRLLDTSRAQAVQSVSQCLRKEARAANELQKAKWFNDFKQRVLQLSGADDARATLDKIGRLFAGNHLSSRNFDALVEKHTAEELYSDNVQFVLRHAAPAFGVTEAAFKATLQRRHVHCRLNTGHDIGRTWTRKERERPPPAGLTGEWLDANLAKLTAARDQGLQMRRRPRAKVSRTGRIATRPLTSPFSDVALQTAQRSPQSVSPTSEPQDVASTTPSPSAASLSPARAAVVLEPAPPPSQPAWVG